MCGHYNNLDKVLISPLLFNDYNINFDKVLIFPLLMYGHYNNSDDVPLYGHLIKFSFCPSLYKDINNMDTIVHMIHTYSKLLSNYNVASG